jgi:methyl coenzyme M reductase beta subunit
MKAETITNGYIALIDFPSNIITVVCDYIKNNIVRDGTVKSEKIDDTSIDYFAPFNSSSFISHNSTLLNNYRKVFRQSFYEVLKVECVN